MRPTIVGRVLLAAGIAAGVAILAATGEGQSRTRSAAAPGCRLVLSRATDITEPMFHLEGVYVVRNAGAASCRVSGFPSLAAYRAQSARPFTGGRIPIAEESVGRRRAAVLPPGARLGFVVTHQLDPSRSTPCPPTTFVVTFPGAPGTLTIRDPESFDVCPARDYANPVWVTALRPVRSLPRPARKWG